jgi:hypothetical protein
VDYSQKKQKLYNGEVMNFNQEKPSITETTPEKITPELEISTALGKQADLFLGNEKDIIKPAIFLKILDEVKEKVPKINESIKSGENKRQAVYDKSKKSFQTENENDITAGKIIAARRWGIDVGIPETPDQTDEESRTRTILLEKLVSDELNGKLNKEIATRLAESIKKFRPEVSEAYSKIAERSGERSKQFGIIAEQIVLGVLEEIAIDRNDLGLTVMEANAFQDVYNKIDFIITTHQARRGVGVNRDQNEIEEKSIGIQFTTNKLMAEHKMDQINKVKERGTEVDDIVYVDINNKLLKGAVNKWKKLGRPIAGPWNFLPPEIRKKTLTRLFNGLLTPEQEKSLIKDIK